MDKVIQISEYRSKHHAKEVSDRHAARVANNIIRRRLQSFDEELKEAQKQARRGFLWTNHGDKK